MKLSKPLYSKILFFTICSVFFTANPAIAEHKESKPLFNTSKKDSDDKKQMKNISWIPAEKEKSETEEKDVTAEDEVEKELTSEEELWKKYKELAAGSPDKEAQKEDKENTSKEDKGTEDKKNNGLSGIIEDYKKAQESKGKMNSRSFGNID